PAPVPSGWRNTLWQIIFEADTPAGKGFDVALLVLILVSVLSALLESVDTIGTTYHQELLALEWVITILFTVEYILRLLICRKPIRYVTSFFGLIDLLAILPTYMSLFVTGTHYLSVIRVIRLLRVFRIFKLARYISQAKVLMAALRASMPKITVFVFAVLTLVIIVGSLMYLVEGPEHGFTSIPASMYWGIVTLTTVGYGDIAPQTPMGKMLASVVMMMGYGIIAVPTGIVTVELSQASRGESIGEGAGKSITACPTCTEQDHEVGAAFCRACGVKLVVN
ncbi:MAG: ion transporter, partial [Vampirovibrio sp.]|nr:ion transporter [Vampirovibrio sp.]